MFEGFYGFNRTPFSRDIPTDQLFQSHRIEETWEDWNTPRSASNL